MRASVLALTECMKRRGDSGWYPDAYSVSSAKYPALVLRDFLSQDPRRLCHHGVGLLAFCLPIPYFLPVPTQERTPYFQEDKHGEEEAAASESGALCFHNDLTSVVIEYLTAHKPPCVLTSLMPPQPF